MLARFEDYYSPEPMSGCWIWTRAINGDGYGIIRVGSRTTGTRKLKRAHRLSYELFKGLITDGLQIDHKCFVRCCVNPDHLEAVTNKENIIRSWEFRKRTNNPRKQRKNKIKRIDAIHKHLLVIENRLECLVVNGWIQDCDELDMLRDSLSQVLHISAPTNRELVSQTDFEI